MATSTSDIVLRQLQSRLGSADWSQWSVTRFLYYDYVRYPAAGTTQLAFFANPLGSTDPVSAAAKTLEETNAPKSRSFGQQYYICFSIRTHLDVLAKNRQAAGISGQLSAVFDDYRTVADVLQRIANSGVLNWKIGQKSFYDIHRPFRFCPPGFGVQIERHSSKRGAGGVSWLSQDIDPDNIYQLTPPQLIEPEQTFDLTIDFPDGAPAALTALVNATDLRLNVGVVLDGYVARPAQ